ncbi:hypothetical protein ACFXKD_27800 [Nocardiopsis aegyptia]|uniref:hypothetical protein n=1 Tax=Nocardiopsis aegyptia TaxID=220378 RepID=UPI00366C4746
MERLGTYVHAAGQLWRPGQVPPDEVADLITNPKAWTSQALDRQEMTPAAIPSPNEGQGDDDPNEADATEGDTREEGPAVDDTTGVEDEEDQAPAPAAAAEAEPQRPAKSDQVGAWREYILAVADITQAEVDEMTKAELIDAADQLDAE